MAHAPAHSLVRTVLSVPPVALRSQVRYLQCQLIYQVQVQMK